MSGSYTGGGFGGGFPGRGPGGPGQGLWEVMEQLRGMFEQKVGRRRAWAAATCARRCSRSSPRSRCTATRSSSEIDERSGGAWKPSAGSVYPTLQLLADEGLISAEESNGRKTYSLTEAGRARLPRHPVIAPRRGRRRLARCRHATAALPKAGVELAQAAAQVQRTGTPEQVKQAVEVLDEARRRSTRSSLRTDRSAGSIGPAEARLGALGTSGSRRCDARRRQHARPLPADPAVRRALHRPDVVVRARSCRASASRRSRRAGARRGCTRIARRFHVLAVDLGGLMIKVGQYLSSRLDVLPPEITKELEGLQDEVPPVPFDAIRRARRGRAGRAARARRTRRSTRCRWPRHPSVKRTAPRSRRSRRRRHGARRGRRQGAATGHRDDRRRRPRGAAPRRRMAQPRAVRLEPRRPPRARRGVRRHEPRGDRLPARGRQRRAVRRELRRRPAGRRARSRLGAHDAPRADARRRDGDQDQRRRRPAGGRASTRRRSRSSSRPSCSTSSSRDGFFHADPHPGNIFVTPVPSGGGCRVASDASRGCLRAPWPRPRPGRGSSPSSTSA